MYKEMSPANRDASKNIQKFLLVIPPTSHSQFLAAISSDKFLKTFTSISSDVADNIQVKIENQMRQDEDKGYATFAAAQSDTSKEEYECYKRQYVPTNCFSTAKIPFQTFASGFQVTSAP